MPCFAAADVYAIRCYRLYYIDTLPCCFATLLLMLLLFTLLLRFRRYWLLRFAATLLDICRRLPRRLRRRYASRYMMPCCRQDFRDDIFAATPTMTP